MLILSFSSLKGGVGKTTLAVHTALALREQLDRELVYILDASGGPGCSTTYLMREEHMELFRGGEARTLIDVVSGDLPAEECGQCVYQTRFPGLAIVPLQNPVRTLSKRQMAAKMKLSTLADVGRKLVEELWERVSYLIIDPPAYSLHENLVFMAMTHIILPVVSEEWPMESMDAAAHIAEYASIIRRGGETPSVPGFIYNRYRSLKSPLGKLYADLAAEKLDMKCVARVPEDPVLTYMWRRGRTLFDYKFNTPAKRAFRALAKWVLRVKPSEDRGRV